MLWRHSDRQLVMSAKKLGSPAVSSATAEVLAMRPVISGRSRERPMQHVVEQRQGNADEQ